MSINSKRFIIFFLFYTLASSKYVEHTKAELVTAVLVRAALKKEKIAGEVVELPCFWFPGRHLVFFVVAVFVTMNLSGISSPSGMLLILPPTDQTNAIHWLQSLKCLVFFCFVFLLVFHLSGSTAATVKCNLSSFSS